AHDFAPILRIEARRHRSRADEIAEENRELSSLAVDGRRGTGRFQVRRGDGTFGARDGLTALRAELRRRVELEPARLALHPAAILSWPERAERPRRTAADPFYFRRVAIGRSRTRAAMVRK